MADRQDVKLLMSEFVTHDVKRFVVERPTGFTYEAGHGVELAINDPEWSDKGRPFTPTNLSDDEVLEFIIKAYPDHNGVTQKLHSLDAGAMLSLTEPFGAISYRGPGVFIAGGAGITPFLAILRELAQKDKLDEQTLLFSNKKPADIIAEKELRHYLGTRCILTCTDTSATDYDHRRIDKDFLAENISDFSQNFYVCGPPPFMEAINAALEDLGADSQSLIFER
jgi:cytochrome-b5 reductase